MRAQRLLALLLVLQARGRMTATELAAELEVSVRTVYRDVEALGAAGVPVYAERGVRGGFRLVDGYRTRLTGLSADEAVALLLVGLPGPAAALGLGRATERARGKLLAALPAAASAQAGKVAARVHLDPLGWYRAPLDEEHLPTLARAVLDERVVQLSYASWSGVRDWRIEPLGLVLTAGAWYAVADTSVGRRTFKVASVRAAQALEEGFTRPAQLDLAAHWAGAVGRFEERLRPERALVLASPLGRRRLARLGAYAEEAVALAEPTGSGSGWATVRLPVEGIEDAALVLLGIGPEVVVVDPPALRDRVAELAAAILARALGDPSTEGGPIG